MRERDITESIQGWLHSAPLTDLITHFGGPAPAADLRSALAQLDAWSAGVWDFRNGAERQDARRQAFPRTVAELVGAVADALGMARSSHPSRRRYDHLLVLGGLLPSCLRRTAFAAEIAAGTAIGDITALAALRQVTPAETEPCPALGLPECATEFDGMQAGVRRAFGLAADPVREFGGDPVGDPWNAWRHHRYPANRPPVEVLAAPSSDPQVRRANTADTYSFWARRRPGLAAGQTVLLVTSSLHVPFQHLDAVRVLTLRHRCTVETVGVTSATREGPPAVATTLQEIRSALCSALRLVQALGGTAPGSTR